MIGDALAQFPADEIVLTTLSEEKSHGRLEDLAEKVRERHGKPLRDLVLTAREAGASTEPDVTPTRRYRQQEAA